MKAVLIVLDSMGIGGATRYSVCKSRKEEGEANAVFTDTLYLAAVVSVNLDLLLVGTS